MVYHTMSCSMPYPYWNPLKAVAKFAQAQPTMGKKAKGAMASDAETTPQKVAKIKVEPQEQSEVDGIMADPAKRAKASMSFLYWLNNRASKEEKKEWDNSGMKHRTQSRLCATTTITTCLYIIIICYMYMSCPMGSSGYNHIICYMNISYTYDTYVLHMYTYVLHMYTTYVPGQSNSC